MEQSPAPEQRVRQTISMTHRQLGVGVGGLVALFTMLAPIKAYFFTREEGLTQSKEIAELKKSQDDQFADLRKFIAAGQEDQVHRLERSNDKLVERIKDAETRTSNAESRLDRRMDSIELAFRLKSIKTSN